MSLRLSERVLPARQPGTLEELVEDLDLGVGDAQSKKTAFWTMLVLSGVIATGGVVSDSTATVIGAMIIAPLPPTRELVAELDGRIPSGLPIVVTTTLGEHISAGVVGQTTAG